MNEWVCCVDVGRSEVGIFGCWVSLFALPLLICAGGGGHGPKAGRRRQREKEGVVCGTGKDRGSTREIGTTGAAGGACFWCASACSERERALLSLVPGARKYTEGTRLWVHRPESLSLHGLSSTQSLPSPASLEA